MSIRFKLLFLLGVVGLLPALFAAWLDSRLLQSLSRDLTRSHATTTAVQAHAQLVHIANEYAARMARESRHVRQLVNLQAWQVESLLAAPVAPNANGPTYTPESFERGEPALALTPWTAAATGRSGQAAPPLVSWQHPVLHRAPGTAPDASADEARALAPLAGFLARLRSADDPVLRWQYIVLESGLSLSYPGHGGYPADFDPRARPWYAAQREAPGLRWYWPHIDASTGSLVVNATMPLFDADGRFRGITGIDVDLMATFDSLTLPPELRPGSALVQAAVLDEPGTPRRVVVLARDRGQGATGHWEVLPELADLTLGDDAGTQALTAAMLRGEDADLRVAVGDAQHFVLARRFDSTGAYIVMSVPVAQATRSAAAAARYAAEVTHWHQYDLLMSLLTAAGVIALVAFVAAHRVTAPLRALTQAVDALAAGRFDTRVAARGKDEVGKLGKAFNAMVPRLEEHARTGESLALAREVQQALLPPGPPALPAYDIAGTSFYSEQTGGDYFDYVPLESVAPGRLAVVVADVSGHGIGPSLLMATTRALLHGGNDRGLSLGGMLRHVNRQLVDDVSRGHFVTLFLLALEAGSNRIEWASAGHDPALHYRAIEGDIVDLGGSDIPLGISADWAYGEAGRCTLAAGDVVLIGTDGLWDTQSAADERYGKARLRAFLAAHATEPAAAICSGLQTELGAFRGARPQGDDTTIVVVKRIVDGAVAGEPQA